MRIPKGPCLIDIGPSLPSQVRAVGEHIKFLIKTQRNIVHREKSSTFVEERRREISHKTEHKQILREIKNAVELKIFIA
jgi:hypothetical protein